MASHRQVLVRGSQIQGIGPKIRVRSSREILSSVRVPASKAILGRPEDMGFSWFFPHCTAFSDQLSAVSG
jgi:hypothetical protein